MTRTGTSIRARIRSRARDRGRAWSLLLGAVVLGSAVTATANPTSRVPWPDGAHGPTDDEVDQLIEEAVGLDDRETQGEFLEAFERGEASEEIFLQQEDVDLRTYDHDRIFQFGDTTFAHEFINAEGYASGPRKLTPPSRVHKGARGGLDNYSCAGCHSVGGPNGSGSFAQNTLAEGDGARASSSNPRNPLAILGSGFVDLLGREMTADLARVRDEAVARAKASRAAVSVELVTKGVSYGTLRVDRAGNLDTTGVEGISPDLVVRPFGWKGTTASIRRFDEEALRIHFGIQSSVLITRNQHTPDPARLGSGPKWWDPDDDGTAREIEEGTLSALEVYAAMLEVPTVLPPAAPELRRRWARGTELFDTLGCVACHRRKLTLEGHVFDVMPDTTGGVPVPIDLLSEGDEPRSGKEVALFSDLKRHDMGPGLADPHDAIDRVGRSVFMTRRLWGLAETAPYLHDGRAPTIPEAILAHGGEAKGSRDAFAAMSAEDRGSVHVFLLSLTRASKPLVTR